MRGSEYSSNVEWNLTFERDGWQEENRLLSEPEVASEMKRSADRGAEAKSMTAVGSREDFRDREKHV
jgi:hypothetical protein